MWKVLVCKIIGGTMIEAASSELIIGVIPLTVNLTEESICFFCWGWGITLARSIEIGVLFMSEFWIRSDDDASSEHVCVFHLWERSSKRFSRGHFVWIQEMSRMFVSMWKHEWMDFHFLLWEISFDPIQQQVLQTFWCKVCVYFSTTLHQETEEPQKNAVLTPKLICLVNKGF